MAVVEKKVKQTNGYKVIGTRPIRHDGTDKVTGSAKIYGADMHLPGMLYGKVLRSPHAHARIVSIDTNGGGIARRQGSGDGNGYAAGGR
ncbi:MAG: hypothetical protein R2854_14955 [Caldilineaceae bacterium]